MYFYVYFMLIVVYIRLSMYTTMLDLLAHYLGYTVGAYIFKRGTYGIVPSHKLYFVIEKIKKTRNIYIIAVTAVDTYRQAKIELSDIYGTSSLLNLFIDFTGRHVLCGKCPKCLTIQY